MRRLPIFIVLLSAVVTTSAGRCGDDPRPEPSAATPPSRTPGVLTGAEMTTPTGLRLLVPRHLLEVDTGSVREVGATGWLMRPGREPLLVDENRRSEEVGPARIGTSKEADLPGKPTVVQLDLPALTTVIPGLDDGTLWAVEYTSRTTCVLRQFGFDGRDRGPARPVACGTRPAAETSHGVWVTVGPDAYEEAATGAVTRELRSVLLDPGSLAEKAAFPLVEVIDDHRVLVVGGDGTEPFRLHDLRSGEAVAVPRPPHAGWSDPRVSPLSADGRWLAFTYGEPGVMPQVMDVWVLDLPSLGWTRAPGMPLRASLKDTDVSWAPDGRLVMLGGFSDAGEIGHEYGHRLLATWRPGEPRWALLPFERPATPRGEPHDTRFLVF